MKRIGETTGGTAGGQDGDLRPFGAAEVAAMSAATSPGTGLAYGLRRVCAAWGSPLLVLRMTSGQHAEQPPAKRRGPKPASDQALLVAMTFALGGRGLKVLGFGSVATSGLPASGCSA